MPDEPLADFMVERGYIGRGVPLMKYVAALPGQTICRTGSTVTVDAVPLGDALDRDKRGRELPVWHGWRRIAKGDIFLMNPDVPDSLDGRYFGPISDRTVIGKAAVPIGRRPDRARLPVTMLRQSDGKVRRDGSSAADVQPEHPVAERGGVQGASELEASERKRVMANSAVYYRIRNDERRCLQEQWKNDRLGGRDKMAQGALRLGGCFYLGICSQTHIAPLFGNVRHVVK